MSISKWSGPSIRNQSGDTIVEVLIAVTIVATILASAFVLTQKSSNGVQTAQEHTQAQRILQDQIEKARSIVTDPAQVAAFNTMKTQQFCINDTGVTTAMSSCTRDDRYTIKAKQKSINATDPNYGLYAFDITWDKLGGGTNSETLYYRLYQATPYQSIGLVGNPDYSDPTIVNPPQCPSFTAALVPGTTNAKVTIDTQPGLSYTVTRTTNGTVTTLAANTLGPVTDNNITPNVDNNYQVTAKDNTSQTSSGCGAQTVRINFTCPAFTVAASSDARKVTISISGSTGSTYTVLRTTPNAGTVANNTAATTVDDTSVTDSTYYAYRVNITSNGATLTCPTTRSVTTPSPTYVPLYLCLVRGTSDYMESADGNCEGQIYYTRLGFMIAPNSPVIPAGSKRIDRYVSTVRRNNYGGYPVMDHLIVATTGPVGSNMPWSGLGYRVEASIGYSAPASTSNYHMDRCYDYVWGVDNFAWYSGSCGGYAQANDGNTDFYLRPY